MTLLGEPVEADEALRLGLVTEVVDLADLDAAVDRWAERLANGPSAAIGLTKVVPWQYAMYEAVFSLDESVRAVGELQRANHAQRIQRELLEEFAIAARIGAQARG